MKHPTKTRLYTVYHIRPKGETDTSKYYIGITKNSLSVRLGQHMCSNRPIGDVLRALGRDSVEIVPLHKAPLHDALQLEFNYRPRRFMGWNIQAGGEESTVKCSGCGKLLPKRKTGAMCSACNHTKFSIGQMPHSFGTGIKCILVSPEGEEFIPYSLHQFCKERGLVTANIRKVLKGERKQSKGWTARLIDGEG